MFFFWSWTSWNLALNKVEVEWASCLLPHQQMQFFTFYIFKTCLTDFQTKEIKEKTPNPFPTNRTSYEKFKTLGKQKLVIERIFFFASPIILLAGYSVCSTSPPAQRLIQISFPNFRLQIFFGSFLLSFTKLDPNILAVLQLLN